MKIRPSIPYSLLVTVPSVIFFSFLAVFLYPLDWIFLRRRQRLGKWGATVSVVKIGWGLWMMKAHGIKPKILGPAADQLKDFKGVVFVSNHQSMVDIIVQIAILPKGSSFIAKKELKYIPLFGWAAAAVGVFFIDRSKGTQNEALGKMDALLHDGFNIIIYPEGTRSWDGKLLPFKRGAFVMAISAGADIVPLTILNSRELCPKGRVSIGPGEVKVIVDKPISTKGLTMEDRHKLSDQVRDIIAKHLEKFEESRDTY